MKPAAVKKPAENIHTGVQKQKSSTLSDIDNFNEIPTIKRGVYGQDIYNGMNPMNEFDILSPYYKKTTDFLNSPLGYNSDPFLNPFNSGPGF